MSVRSETRPLVWSVRRELWENRSIVVAPLVVTGIVLFASLLGMVGLPERVRSLTAPGSSEPQVAVFRPFTMAPAPIMLATILVGLFYCLDALYAERRDRSILFWKSLPISDRTTVLSKAIVPLAVLPLIGFVLSVATVVCLLLLGTLVLQASGVSSAALWAEARVIQEPLIMLYGLVVHALWFAPIYGWLLLVSAWSRRIPLLWAVLPPFALVALERLAFGTSSFAALLAYRASGAMTEGFGGIPGHDVGVVDHLSQLSPLRFLASPGLWIGLVFASGCFVVAVRLRRDREPI